MIANWVPTKTGKVRAVCQWCDRRSKPVEPADDGRPGFWDLRGWSEAPLPVDFENRDGSFWSLYTCPQCASARDQRRSAGATVLLVPSPERQAAIRAQIETECPRAEVPTT